MDEQALTGESRPVLKQPGDRVVGGTLNLDGDLRIAVTEAGDTGTLARVVELVRVARESKGRYQRLADRVAGRFVPVVLAIAAGRSRHSRGLWFLERGLWAALAVALIACPCALGLAAPLAIWSAVGNAAGRRVLFRNGEALERLAGITAVRFDKTGTLTTGSASVSSFVPENASHRQPALARAAALSAASSHALSRAIAAFADAEHVIVSHDISGIRVVSGLGVIGINEHGADSIVLGSRGSCSIKGWKWGQVSRRLESAQSRGLPVTLVGWEGRAHGLFVFEEDWRAGSVSVIRWLAGAARRGRAHWRPCEPRAADRRAARCSRCGRAASRPESSGDPVRRRALGPVCMVGDGINDAPALSASDVGIALGCGSDLTRDSASICLLGNDLGQIPWSIELARRTCRTIRWNLLWAFGYNSVGVACAAMGWLNPALAAFLMVASGAHSLTVQLASSHPAVVGHSLEAIAR